MITIATPPEKPEAQLILVLDPRVFARRHTASDVCQSVLVLSTGQPLVADK